MGCHKEGTTAPGFGSELAVKSLGSLEISPPDWTRSGGLRHPHSSCSTAMKISACWRRLRLVELALAAKTFTRARDVLCY